MIHSSLPTTFPPTATGSIRLITTLMFPCNRNELSASEYSSLCLFHQHRLWLITMQMFDVDFVQARDSNFTKCFRVFILKVVVLPEFCICNSVFVFQPFSTKIGTKVENNMFEVHKSSKTEKHTFMLIYVNFKIFGNAKIMKKVPTFMHDAAFRF